MKQSAEELVYVKTECCPACEWPERHKVLYRLDSFVVKACSCGHRFIDPALDTASQMRIYQSSDALRKVNPALEYYFDYDSGDEETATFRDYARTLSEIEQLRPSRGNLLEIGCGSGSFLKAAQKRGWRVTGVDSSAENIERIKRDGVEGVCSHFLGYETSERYDCIALWDLIEHIQVPRIFLEKSYELLVPGGILMVATPHYPNFLSRVAETVYRMSLGNIASPLKQLYVLEHTSYFSAKTLGRLMERSGFQVLKFWKTETDLNRYRFPLPLKFALRVAFANARLLGWQNRVNMLAMKPACV